LRLAPQKRGMMRKRARAPSGEPGVVGGRRPMAVIVVIVVAVTGVELETAEWEEHVRACRRFTERSRQSCSGWFRCQVGFQA
jgi:hypothetical protein